MRACTATPSLTRTAARSLLDRSEPCLLARGRPVTRAFATAPTPRRSPLAPHRQAPRPRLQPLPRRAYHSYSHPPPPGPFNPTEQLLLSSAYAHVPAHGFTTEALALGARDAGYLDISTNLLANGVFDLIRWHLVTRREALVSRAGELDAAAGMRTADKVFELTWQRLLGNSEVISRLQEVCFFTARFPVLDALPGNTSPFPNSPSERELVLT
jgi:ubiquinone biosynthesis protein COQ9